nr:DUF202 domain-containing protein [Telmatospirillum sp. J64-1]
MAAERTYSAWIRTGLAALVSGLGVERFLHEVLPFWALRASAVALIVFGIMTFLMAAWRYRKISDNLHGPDIGRLPPWLLVLLSSILAAAAMGALTGVWFR